MNKHIEDDKGKARFKNNSGVWLTRALFYETSPSKDTVVFTLKEEDHEGYPSLYRLFMEADDPEEYRFATEHLGGWSHWKTLKSSTWFKEFYDDWAEELEIRQRSRAVAKIMEAASKGSGRDAIEASKYVAEKKWDKKPAARGRPTQAKIKQEAEKIFEANKQAANDLERIIN